MARRPETVLHSLLRASREAGYIVAAAKVEGDRIELTYETTPDTLSPDVLDWKPRR